MAETSPPPEGGTHKYIMNTVIWKCVIDRIIYIVQKGINIFFKKGVFKAGGGAQNVLSPTQLISYGFKGSVIHQIMPSLHGRSLEITLTVKIQAGQ